MTTWTAGRVAEIVGSRSPLPGVGLLERRFDSISTDTRSLEAGSLFVALAGDRFDAHDFLEDAARAGATGAVVREGTRAVKGLVLLEVQDTLRALGLLARARREEVAGPVVAVTGT